MRFIVLPTARWILDALDFRRLRERKLTFLEITPPTNTTKTPLATEQWYSSLHGLLMASSRKGRLMRHKSVLTLELPNSRSEGIRFLAVLDPSNVAIFQQLLVSYLPAVRFREVGDYLKGVSSPEASVVLEFKQTNHFSHSLAPQDILSQHDPFAYIAGAMVKPLPGELTALQVVLSPAFPRAANQVHNQLLDGKDAGIKLSYWQYPFAVLGKLSQLMFGMLTAISDVTSDRGSGNRDSHRLASNAPAVTPALQQLMDRKRAKLSQPLFNVEIRALVIGSGSNERAEGVANSLYMLRVPGLQALVRRSNFPRRYKVPHRQYAYWHRMPSMFTSNSCVLSASELASIYHFPYGTLGQTENVIRTYSRTLPAEAALKAQADNGAFDVLLGENDHHGSNTPIGLTAAERERHVYVVGGTGNGKTTMLQYAIVQDIHAGKGVAVVDPHGDLAETILQHIPPERIKDVVYFNPLDIRYPVGLNLMELPEGLDEDARLMQQDFLTEAIVSIFRKTFSDDDTGGHRIEYMLRSTIRTAFTIEGATLFTLYDLLTDDKYRKKMTAKLTDKRLRQFWMNEYGQAGGMQRVKMAGGVTNKLGRFDGSEAVRRVIEQTHSTIDFDDIMNSNKILVCNFAKGGIGEDTSELFGIAVLAKLQLAALRRANISREKRTPYYLYVDEFQNFATMSFVQLLSEARKYKLFLTMAEQSLAQQADQRLVQIILDNVGTVICFRVRTGTEQILLPIFQPHIDVGEISSLSAYHYYARISGLENHEPLSGETVLLKNEGSEEIARRVITASRKNYASKYVAPEKMLQQSTDKPPTASKNKRDDQQISGLDQALES